MPANLPNEMRRSPDVTALFRTTAGWFHTSASAGSLLLQGRTDHKCLKQALPKIGIKTPKKAAGITAPRACLMEASAAAIPRLLLLQKGLCLDPALQFAKKLIYQNELVVSQQNKINSF